MSKPMTREHFLRWLAEGRRGLRSCHAAAMLDISRAEAVRLLNLLLRRGVMRRRVYAEPAGGKVWYLWAGQPTLPGTEAS